MRRVRIIRLIAIGLFCQGISSACEDPPNSSASHQATDTSRITTFVDTASSMEPIPPPQPVPTTRTQSSQSGPNSLAWTALTEGLEYVKTEGHLKTNIGDSKIHILRIDPQHFDLVLHSAKQSGKPLQTAPEWAASQNLIAVVNAGMYLADYKTNLGYMQIGDFVNQSRVNADKAILAIGSGVDSLPSVQIIDRECQNWEALRPHYHSFTQSIRMVDCHQRNKWSQQARYWSMVVIAMDQEGRVLFIHTRSPWSVHDFIDMLQALPIDLYNAMYLEGGPEASFYLNYNGFEVAQVGSYETGFYESDDNRAFWQIPNIIGVKKLKK